MFAYEIPGMRFSLPAGGAVKRHRFVSADSTSNGIQATASTQVIGVSMNEITAESGTVKLAGQILEIADGIVIVEAGAAVNAGALVYSDADGKATATAGTVVAGIAITAATAAGQLVSVKVH